MMSQFEWWDTRIPKWRTPDSDAVFSGAQVVPSALFKWVRSALLILIGICVSGELESDSVY